MAQVKQQAQQVSIEAIKRDPELITRLLLRERDVSLLFEKRGDQVHYAYLKTYDIDFDFAHQVQEFIEQHKPALEALAE